MSRMIIVDAAEGVACPKCAHAFALSEGISRQAIERHAEDFDRTLAERARKMEAELAADARRKAERDAARQVNALTEQVDALKQAVASAQAEGQSHKEHIEKARQQAAAAAREQFELELQASKQALNEKESALAHQRSNELALRRQVRELEDSKKNQELDYQRKLDEERRRILDAARQSAADDFARRKAQPRAQIDSTQREAVDLKRKLRAELAAAPWRGAGEAGDAAAAANERDVGVVGICRGGTRDRRPNELAVLPCSDRSHEIKT